MGKLAPFQKKQSEVKVLGLVSLYKDLYCVKQQGVTPAPLTTHEAEIMKIKKDTLVADTKKIENQGICEREKAATVLRRHNIESCYQYVVHVRKELAL